MLLCRSQVLPKCILREQPHAVSLSCCCSPCHHTPCLRSLLQCSCSRCTLYVCPVHGDVRTFAAAAAAAKPKPKPSAPDRKPASGAKPPKSEAERALTKNESAVKREVEQEQKAEEHKAHKQQVMLLQSICIKTSRWQAMCRQMLLWLRLRAVAQLHIIANTQLLRGECAIFI